MVCGSWRSTVSRRRSLFRLGCTLLGDRQLKEFFIWEFKILPLSQQLGVKKISIFLWWLLTCGASDGLTRRMLVSHWEGWDWSELSKSCRPRAKSEWLTCCDKLSAKSKITPGPDAQKSCMFMCLKMAREKYVFDKGLGTNYFAYI